MKLDTDITIPVCLIALIIGAIALALHSNIHVTKKECTCNIPKNEVMYSIVDDKGNVIKQVSKSELKQIKYERH